MNDAPEPLNRRILITGASRGLGRATALRLAGPGISLGLAGRAPSPELTEVLRIVKDRGARAVQLSGDLADPEVPASLVNATSEAFGGLDGLVINAAIGLAGPLLARDLAAWTRVFDVNVRATWLLAATAHPHLSSTAGSIVVIGSISGLVPHVGLGAYSASKAAVAMLVRQMAQEWAADRVRVNAVLPGYMLTSSAKALLYDVVPGLLEERAESIPLGRLGEPREVADAVSFFLSDSSSYCTGQELVVDGGYADSRLARDAALDQMTAVASQLRDPAKPPTNSAG